ncbi:hypothetical protein AB6A40_010115 [Gnathostoma spinigerum]|uniref:PAZ domain-containing protein n=1 Tax=Gnathostoma spinigerum TaxID=75299 RepID=A0ABD6EU73_9BILA
MILRYNELSSEIQAYLGETMEVHITISECREHAHTFRLRDFASSVNRDLTQQDHSLRQFFEILTNQSGLQEGTHFGFGTGRVFRRDSAPQDNNSNDIRGGKKLLAGVEKGVRFIDRSDGLIPALVVDSKRGVFYKDQQLLRSLEEMFGRDMQELSNPDIFSQFVKRASNFVRDLRMYKFDSTKVFVPNYVSKRPIRDLRCRLERNGPTCSVLEKFFRIYPKQRFRSDLPAVVVKRGKLETYFPVELLVIAEGQRVPLAVQSARDTANIIKKCVVKPMKRFAEIRENMEALDLCGPSRRNPYMEAFGVRVSQTPLKVLGNRRAAPDIGFAGSHGKTVISKVDRNKANWTCNNNQFVLPARLSRFFAFYSDVHDDEIAK